MSDQIEPGQRAAVKALRTAMKAFSSQALALNRIFSRTVKDAMPGNLRFHEDMRMALKAQAQYRTTLKTLMALEGERNAEEKSRNSRKRTIENGNSAA